MTEWVKDFVLRSKSDEERKKVQEGLGIFCHNNSKEFTDEVLGRIGLPSVLPPREDAPPGERDAFVDHLAKLRGECVFLLRDPYAIMRSYQEKTGRGFGIMANRRFLCRSEEDYFELIGLVYGALQKAEGMQSFLRHYLEDFIELTERDAHFRDRAEQIADYIQKRTPSRRRLIWVDYGFQFTFMLFCWASVATRAPNISQDFFSFTTYTWLQEFFEGYYFSKNFEFAFAYELEGVEAYERERASKGAASLVGFAIGDSLGFPSAGIDAKDVPRFLALPIQGFTDNKRHPYFSHLEKGQYTDNTVMLLLSAQSVLKHGGFKVEEYAEDLAAWGKRILSGEIRQRWAGPTALAAIERLIESGDYRTSGSTTTESCSSTYRVVPLGLFYQPFVRRTRAELASYAEISGAITHNSEISRTGAVLVALIVSELMTGALPRTAVDVALRRVQRTDRNAPLLDRIEEAIAWTEKKTIEQTRKKFGTGSPIYQTLPLAIYCFLKYQDDFAAGVLASANSFRDDTPEERRRLKGMSWDEQLIAAKGGNADGIAGLTGALLGAHLGLEKIPADLAGVEDAALLANVGTRLATWKD